MLHCLVGSFCFISWEHHSFHKSVLHYGILVWIVSVNTVQKGELLISLLIGKDVFYLPIKRKVSYTADVSNMPFDRTRNMVDTLTLKDPNYLPSLVAKLSDLK